MKRRPPSPRPEAKPRTRAPQPQPASGRELRERRPPSRRPFDSRSVRGAGAEPPRGPRRSSSAARRTSSASPTRGAAPRDRTAPPLGRCRSDVPCDELHDAEIDRLAESDRTTKGSASSPRRGAGPRPTSSVTRSSACAGRWWRSTGCETPTTSAPSSARRLSSASTPRSSVRLRHILGCRRWPCAWPKGASSTCCSDERPIWRTRWRASARGGFAWSARTARPIAARSGSPSRARRCS